MKRNAQSQPNTPWVLFILACALPFAFLYLLLGLGWAIPVWLFVVALLVCFLMPFMAMRRGQAGAERHGDTTAGAHEVRRDDETLARALFDAAPGLGIDARGWEVTAGGVLLRGPLRRPPTEVQEALRRYVQEFDSRQALVMIHEDAHGQPYVFVADAELRASLADAVPRRRPWLSLGLFLGALVTTTLAGAAHAGVDLPAEPTGWLRGLPYGLGVMAILGVHEMGHYLAARTHGVPVSLPYFIPVPFALGTFGAFISMPPLLKDRRQLFDIGVAGPVAGLLVALPALAIGLRHSSVSAVELPQGGHLFQGVSIDSSLLLTIVAKLSISDAIAQGHYVVLHPLAFAGWIGLFVTALNLIPIGQLDGGHVAHALLGGTRAATLASVALFGMILLGFFLWSALLWWAAIIYFIAGRRGLPPLDDVTPLDPTRRAIGVAAFVLLLLIITPLPHALFTTLGLHCPYA